MITVGRKWSVLLGFLLGEEDRGKSEISKVSLCQLGVYLGELKNVNFSSLYLYYFILHRPCILQDVASVCVSKNRQHKNSDLTLT